MMALRWRGTALGPMRNLVYDSFRKSVFLKEFDSVQTDSSVSFSLNIFIFAECCGSRREVLRVVMTIVIGNKHEQAAANGALPPLLSLSNVHCFFYFPFNIYLTLNEYHEIYHSQGWIAGLLLQVSSNDSRIQVLSNYRRQVCRMAI